MVHSRFCKCGQGTMLSFFFRRIPIWVTLFTTLFSALTFLIFSKVQKFITLTADNSFSVPKLSDNNHSLRGFHAVHIYANETAPITKSYSQVGQDEVILKLVNAHIKKGGSSNKFFVDLASNQARFLSNSLHLEQMGWGGLCIEGNPGYWYELAAFRRCTVVGAFVGGTVDGVQVDVALTNGELGGIVGDGFDNDGKKVDEQRNLVTISTVFKQVNVPNVIDYLSLDVEGAEYLVMKNFPYDTTKIRFMTVERPTLKLQELFKEKGYVRNPKDFVSWGETLWFHPNVTLLTTEEVDKISNLPVNNKFCWTQNCTA